MGLIKNRRISQLGIHAFIRELIQITPLPSFSWRYRFIFNRQQIYCCLLLVLLITSCRLGLDRQHDQENKDVSFTPSILQVGDVTEQGTRSINVRLNNNLSDDIKILHINKSCACTEAALDKSELKSKESGTLHVILNAQDRIGAFLTTIEVYWKVLNSSRQGKSRITILGRATTVANVSPRIINIGNADAATPITSEVIISQGTASVPWNGIIISSDIGEVRQEKITDSQYKVILTLHPSTMPIGEIAGSITIKLCFNGRMIGRKYVLPIEGHIASDISASPNGIFLSVLKPGTIKEGDILIKSTGQMPIRVLSIVPSDPALVVVKSDDSANLKYTNIHYKFVSPQVEGPLRINLNIKVYTNTTKAINVPIIAFIKK
jgi:hypothetical protein